MIETDVNVPGLTFTLDLSFESRFDGSDIHHFPIQDRWHLDPSTEGDIKDSTKVLRHGLGTLLRFKDLFVHLDIAKTSIYTLSCRAEIREVHDGPL